MEGQLGQRADVYKTAMGVQSNLQSNLFDLYKALLGTGLTQKDILELQFKYGPSYNVGDLSQFRTKAEKRTYLRQIWEEAPTNEAKLEISKIAKSVGITSLETGDLNRNELDSLNNTLTQIRDLKRSKEIIESGRLDPYLGLIGGNIANLLTDPKFASLLPDEVHEVAQILRRFQVLGERAAIGGRITGYLLDRVAPAFPNLGQGKNKVLKSISLAKPYKYTANVLYG